MAAQRLSIEMRCAFVRRRERCALTAALLALGWSKAAFATTVEPMTVTTAADFAGQVIIGTVASIDCRWADGPRRIESEIVWEGVEYLKGAPSTADGTFRLVVQGGTIGSRQMRIAGAPEFRVGERWLLFLLPTYKTHPVVGVHQFAMRVVDVGGEARVLSADGEPVLGVDEEGHIAVSRQAASQTQDASSVAGPPPSLERAWGNRSRKLETRNKRQEVPVAGDAAEAKEFSEPRSEGVRNWERAATLIDFTATLRPILAASRRYDLVEPAGQPRISEFTPQRLQAAFGAAHSSPTKSLRGPLPPREDVVRPRVEGDPK